MNSRGMTLIELVVVIGIIGILLTIGTLQFNRYVKKSQVESQVKTMYADLMKVRHDAVYQRRQMVVKLKTDRYSVYPDDASANAETGALLNKKLNLSVISNGSLPVKVVFDTNGFLTATSPTRAICIGPGTTVGSVDSIAIQRSQIRMGKYNGFCNYSGITYQ